uniref:RRM domain-containing protein n=1 Tax=Wuchereria bancrofti TaxID=6293 RepID=A0A1I8F1Y6_WUCBA
MNGYYRNGPRFDRVDQDEVPESKHTVFIRGLPGHIKTDEVKDFFEDHVGPCSFDFIKLSQDQLKLFVAVRFETRDAAKECMHKYVFDLLKFFVIVVIVVAIVLNTIVRQEMIIDNDDDYDKRSKKKCASSDNEGSKKSRSSNSSSRSPSRSQRHSSHERSASPGSLKSRHSEKFHRSQSRTSSYSAPAHERSSSAVPPAPSPQFKREAIEKGETPPLPPLPPPPNAKFDDVEPKKSSLSDSQSPAECKLQKLKKGKRKDRRRSPSSSTPNSVNEHTSDELSEGELRKKILKKRKKVLKKMEGLKPIVKPTLGKWEEQEAETTLLQNTTLEFGLESMEDVPKRVLRNTAHQFQSSKNVISQTNASMLDGIEMHATMLQVGIENSFSYKKGVKELGKQLDLSKSEAPSSGALCSSDIDTFLGKREQTGPINLKNTQTSVFGAARGQQLISFFDDASDTLQPFQGMLRLSSLTRQLNAETERERKLARLPPEVLTKYTTKKKQLEGSFKADRETFGFVTKILIEKDPGLEDRLCLALAEAIKDMEETFTRKMDQYLDHSSDVVHSGKEEKGLELFDKYCLLLMKRLEQQEIDVLTLFRSFAIAVKYGFKDACFQRFKESAARWMCRKLKIIMRDVSEAFRKQLGGNLDKTCRMLFPYASIIFRAGVERFMQYDIPRDMINKSAAELMLVLIAVERKYCEQENARLPSVITVSARVTTVSSLPSIAQKHKTTLYFYSVKYVTILRAYKVLSRYERWRLGGEDVVQSSSFGLGDEIIAALLVKLMNLILKYFHFRSIN